MPEKPSTPDYLYKYTSVTTAMSILKNQTIWWASPPCFNDPYDVQVDVCNWDDKYIQGVAKAWAIELKDTFNQDFTQADCIAKIFEWFLLNKKREEFFNQHVKFFRILCLTTSCDKPHMWANYADENKGVVLKFRITKSLFDRMNLFNIRYFEKMPKYAPILDDFLDDTFDIDEILFERVSIKSKDWEPENEWRFVSIEDDFSKGDEKGSLIKFESTGLDSIYLGLDIDNNHKSKILNLIIAQYPKVKVYQANKGRGFDFEFELINN